MCGRLLERRGVNIRPDDTNELSDTVRTPASPDEADAPERSASETEDGEERRA
jgi:putative membrane protein